MATFPHRMRESPPKRGVPRSPSMRERAEVCALPPASPAVDDFQLSPSSDESRSSVASANSGSSSVFGRYSSALWADEGSRSWIFTPGAPPCGAGAHIPPRSEAPSGPRIDCDDVLQNTATVMASLASLEAAAEQMTEQVRAHTSALRSNVQRAVHDVNILSSGCTTYAALVSETEALKLENAVLRAEVSHLIALLDEERSAAQRDGHTLLDKLRSLQLECHIISRDVDQAVAQAECGRRVATDLHEGAPA